MWPLLASSSKGFLFKVAPTKGVVKKNVPQPESNPLAYMVGGKQVWGPSGQRTSCAATPEAIFFHFRVFSKRLSSANLLKADLRPAPSCGFSGTHDAMNVLGAPCQVRFCLLLSFVGGISSQAWPRLARPLGLARQSLCWPWPGQSWPGHSMPCLRAC